MVNHLIDWLKPVLLYGGAGLLALLALYVVVISIGGVFEIGRETYRGLRYDRKGVCYKCKTPFVQVRSAPADQMYGPDTITQAVCKCGNVGLPSGNRRFAEW